MMDETEMKVNRFSETATLHPLMSASAKWGKQLNNVGDLHLTRDGSMD